MGGVRGIVIGTARRGPCLLCGQEDVALGHDGKPSILHTMKERHQKAAGTFVEPPIEPDRSQRSMLVALAADGPTSPEGRDRETCKWLRKYGFAVHAGGGQTKITDKGRAAIGLPMKGEAT